MRFSEETLMAYADGELDADTRGAVDAAMETDADLADAIALQIENRQALQAKLHAAFNGALTEEVPPRLFNATQTPQVTPTVTDLAAVREAKRGGAQARWSFAQWGAMAASLLIGVFVGREVLVKDTDPFVVQQGRITARTDLDSALFSQSSGAMDRETGIQIGISYLAKNGDYCRTFMLRDAQALAGLACHRNAQWTIDALTPTRTDGAGAYRMANTSVPALILGLVEDTIAGDPLDAEQEAEARERGWQR